MPDRRRRPNSLVGAAKLLAAPRLQDPVTKLPSPEGWQNEAWAMYDTVGELRFATTYLANALSRVRIFAATVPEDPDDDPEPIETGPAADAVARIAGGIDGQAQLLSDMATFLTVPGDGYSVVYEEPDTPGEECWVTASADELVTTREGTYRLFTGPNRQTDYHDLDPETTLISRVWRPHKRLGWLADSPVRAALGTLREIQMLSSHIDASAMSRLAGAGVFAIPSEAKFPASDPGDQRSDVDRFTDELLEAMTTPIRDRDSASAVVPLVLSMPGELIANLKHISFATPFDERVLELRQDAIRRFALSMDVPAEVVLGMASVNHWSAWQIEESTLKIHIEPLAQIICNGLTVGYLDPRLGATPGAPTNTIVWFDVGDLRLRPDRSEDALKLYDRNELAGRALRAESGFSDDDAPSTDELFSQLLVGAMSQAPAATMSVLLPILFGDRVSPEDFVPPGEAPGLPEAEPAPEPDVEPTADDDRALPTP